jgi:hypothetical protein
MTSLNTPAPVVADAPRPPQGGGLLIRIKRRLLTHSGHLRASGSASAGSAVQEGIRPSMRHGELRPQAEWPEGTHEPLRRWRVLLPLLTNQGWHRATE